MKPTGGKYAGAYIPQELLKELTKVDNSLLIGIPKERDTEEKRLALSPEGVEILTNAGHHVLMESGAGAGINYSDSQYAECGAEIVPGPVEVFQADIILKILPPLPAEVALMKNRATLFSMMQLNLYAKDSFEGVMSKKITAVAYELIEDAEGRFPVMNMLNEIEGTVAISIASSLLSSFQGGKGVLLGGVAGVPPTEIVIIGAGTAGTVAARTALGMGALVKIFDDDIHKLRTVRNRLGSMIFTSNFQPNVLQNAFSTADVVIGAMGDMNSRRRYVIAEELVRVMKRGSLVLDLQTNQGGSFETTCSHLPHNSMVFEQYGVWHYCKPSISNYVARTTAMVFSNIFVSMLLQTADAGSVQNRMKMDPVFRSGVYLYSGRPVNDRVSNHFNILSNSLDIYLSAFLNR